MEFAQAALISKLSCYVDKRRPTVSPIQDAYEKRARMFAMRARSNYKWLPE